MLSRVLFFTLLSVSLTYAEFEDCEGSLGHMCRCDKESVRCTGLDELPPWADFPPNTKDFTCLTCSFTTLEKMDHVGLRNLVLLNGELKNISSGAFSQLENLRHLDLSSNSLEVIQPDMFNGLHNLTELRLAYVGIDQFSKEVSEKMPKLSNLDLSGNKRISFERNALANLNLEIFRLNDCELIEPPVLVESDLNSVQHLELNKNKFGTLGDGSFWMYGGLRKLMVEKCEISSIHKDAFEGLSELEKLFLGENKLTKLPEGVFRHTEGITVLDLKGNELETLEHGVVKDLKNLKSVDLSNNPWKCDCAITWVNDFPVPTTTNLTCASPEELAGEGILNATNTLDCPCGYDGCEAKSSNTVALAVGIPIIIICLGLIAFFVYKIVQGRRARADEKKVRYSAVYRDTTENRDAERNPDTRPTSEI